MTGELGDDHGLRGALHGVLGAVHEVGDQNVPGLLLQSGRDDQLIRDKVQGPALAVGKTQETDENVFMKKQFLYGADSRGNAGFGFWQMAFGSDGTGAAG